MTRLPGKGSRGIVLGNTEGVTLLRITAAGPLSGAVMAYGAKNAVLKQMAACLLASGEHTLTHVPNISDVATMGELLEYLGCSVQLNDRHELTIVVPPTSELRPSAPEHLFKAMRASLVVMGPLLARCHEVTMALPGGDDFGTRPINFHTDGLTAMGATFTNDATKIRATTGRRLQGTRFTLEYPSHTATDNLMMAAVLAEGRTVIDNAAREPEVEDLGRQLQAMGANIEGLGTSRLAIEGVAELSAARHEVIPDRVVAATYLAAGLMTSGDVHVVDARADHMEMLLRKMRAMGATIDTEHGIRIQGPARPTAVDVATLPYPGVATDYKPIITAMLTRASGVSVVTENLFDGRFRYVDELIKMGAVIETDGHHAVVHGTDKLHGAEVVAHDIRAGAACVVVGLVADGETLLSGIDHLERGYDDLPGRMTALGAKVERVS
jgi:UDP-N-acetylglucosamine 1-carboxyvinyltransferase